MAIPPKNSNGWAVGALKWIIIAAVGYLISVNTFLVIGQFRLDARGEANKLAIERIDTTLSARALAERVAVQAEADLLRAQVRELQQQQRQERQTQEPSGTTGPARE